MITKIKIRGWRWISLWDNPIVVKEIRTRMRGYRSFTILTLHLLVLILIMLGVYILLLSSLTPSTLDQRHMFGKVIYGLVFGMEMVMVCITAPSLTSGAISTERERQTYELLRVTLLPARSLIWGKYISGFVFVALLLFTSIPVQIPALFIGGVSPEEIFIGTLILMVTAISLSAVGIFYSCLLPRTMMSTVASYGFAIFNVLGLPAIFLVILAASNASLSDKFNIMEPHAQVMLCIIVWLLLSTTPSATIVATEVIILQQNSIWMAKIPLGDTGTLSLVSPWIIYVIISLILSILLFWLSVRLVQRTE
jgi:ABC-2 type transport system permease protein